MFIEVFSKIDNVAVTINTDAIILLYINYANDTQVILRDGREIIISDSYDAVRKMIDGK